MRQPPEEPQSLYAQPVLGFKKLETDADHLTGGACNIKCSPTDTCIMGTCTDVCGNQCGRGETCDSTTKQCIPVDACGNKCMSPNTCNSDTGNCVDPCGNKCSAPNTCNADTATCEDPCGNSCNDPQTCDASTKQCVTPCNPDCTDGKTCNPDGVCVDKCNNSCVGGDVCQDDGSCQFPGCKSNSFTLPNRRSILTQVVIRLRHDSQHMRQASVMRGRSGQLLMRNWSFGWHPLWCWTKMHGTFLHIASLG